MSLSAAFFLIVFFLPFLIAAFVLVVNAFLMHVDAECGSPAFLINFVCVDSKGGCPASLIRLHFLSTASLLVLGIFFVSFDLDLETALIGLPFYFEATVFVDLIDQFVLTTILSVLMSKGVVVWRALG